MKWLQRLIKKIEWKLRKNVLWQPCNIYPTAVIGSNVSVGMFSEIGPNAVIGDNTRIGMGCFIPEGVEIGSNCFLGPKVCFVHDKLLWETFPVGKKHWQKTVVGEGSVIGANVMVCPGITIGSGALIGIGSVLTKDVGPNEVWFGNPARFIKNRR